MIDHIDQPLPNAGFDSRLHRPEARFDAWRDSIGVIFDPALDPCATPTRFYAKVDAALLGTVFLGRVDSVTQSFERSSQKILGDGLDHYLVQVFLEGWCEVEDCGHTRIVRPGDIYIIDAAAPLSAVDYDFRHVTAFVPRDILAPQLVQPDAHHRRVIPGDTPLARLLYGYIKTLDASRFDMTVAEGEAASGPLIGLISSTLNLGPHTARPDPDDKAVDLAVLKMVRDHIEMHLADPTLDVAQVASAFNLSRSRLYRLFEHQHGIAGYIRQRRLRRSLLDLLDPGNGAKYISEIAYRWGFASDTAYNRAFKRQYGCTPKEARVTRMTMHVCGVKDESLHNYERWIRELSI
ncbi:helix-turn-helix domain-containing protein [Alkalilimnicola sp. S0819]|uniref:helix-turn-helix domain-containing protein n=1 Tax=Alkalilimnicola sp. S0819 TaxID=2613922 RepID=UPI001D020580|nr:helix-turn-helix domain-containing protein [Alkalilimnicola sp. S0819]